MLNKYSTGSDPPKNEQHFSPISEKVEHWGGLGGLNVLEVRGGAPRRNRSMFTRLLSAQSKK
eukprot:204432-Prymnesium_polylepis.1